MADIVCSADGGDRIHNHHRSYQSRKRGNGKTRLELFGYQIDDGSDDIRLEVTIKRCEFTELYDATMSQRKKNRGDYLRIRTEVVLAVFECNPQAIIMDDSKEPGATEEVTINMRVSPTRSPRLYALLKPCMGPERNRMFLLFASMRVEVGHGR